MLQINCPYCGAELIEEKWHDDYGKIEEVKDCPECEYIYHWAYGMVVADSDRDRYEQEKERV